MDKSAVENMKYKWSTAKTLKYIRSCTDPETLHMCVCNYNWDDGFEVPEAVLQNPVCTLSTALCLFYDGDCWEAIEDDDEDEFFAEWRAFSRSLYDRILNGEFQTEPKIKFDPGLSRVDLYCLQKELKPEEMVFITPIDGTDCDVPV